ncbi:MAG: protein phosphatase CheZ [Desulfobacteraceae bacterium]|nr:protein phosphatase CheZ [Desulfobacteraceae bacterium]
MGRKAKVNLELGSGFFRIVAEEAIYNITVLGNPGTAPPVAATFFPAEQPGPLHSGPGATGDDYYKQVSTDLYRDIGQLAKSLSATLQDLPMEDRRLKRVELDQAGEKIEDAKSQLKDIVEMTESAAMEIMDCVEDIQAQTSDVQTLLSALKDHRAFSAPEENGSGERGEGAGGAAASIRDQLAKAGEIVARLQEAQPAAPAAAPPPSPRYNFSLDAIFQTLYELCTNETVKGHLKSVREQTGELFDREALLDGLNAVPLDPDQDNFVQLGLPDLLGALAQACSDEKVKNLFKRMDANRETIFIDQSLPLEVPPLDGPPGGALPDGVPAAAISGGAPQLDELGRLLAGSLADLERLPAETGAPVPGMSTMSLADQAEIFSKIESAFGIVNHISADVQKITEALSFQDLSGQQIMKIIKLLSDFQVQLLAIVVSFGSQLKQKEQNASITAAESKRLAQKDVDSYINKIGGPEEQGQSGVLDQDAVNRMLQEMGF